MSASTTSTPISLAFWIASKMTAPGSAPSLPFTTSHPDALAPDLELLHGGRAERVARSEQHLLAVGLQLGGELADGGRLADAVHADHEDHRRLVRRGDACPPPMPRMRVASARSASHTACELASSFFAEPFAQARQDGFASSRRRRRR